MWNTERGQWGFYLPGGCIFLYLPIHKGSLKVFGVVLVMRSLICVTDVEMGE